jgi:hypothetical protein
MIERRDGFGNEFRLKGWVLKRVGPGRDVPSDNAAHAKRVMRIYDTWLQIER